MSHNVTSPWQLLATLTMVLQQFSITTKQLPTGAGGQLRMCRCISLTIPLPRLHLQELKTLVLLLKVTNTVAS